MINKYIKIIKLSMIAMLKMYDASKTRREKVIEAAWTKPSLEN